MLTRYALAYVTTGLVFAAIDAVWLKTMAPTFYRGAIGPLLADQARMGPAIAFYLIYIAGIVLFAVAPAFAHPGGSWKTALGYGAALGFVAYATYDLTNQATLRVWPLRVTLVDLAWGTVLTGTAAALGYGITRAILKS